MSPETGIMSERATMILITRDAVRTETETVTGTTTDDGMQMNDPTVLKARAAIANAIDAPSHLDRRRILRLSFLHALTIRGAGWRTTQQQTSWKRCCSLCSGSALKFTSPFFRFNCFLLHNDSRHESTNKLTIPTTCLASVRTYIIQRFHCKLTYFVLKFLFFPAFHSCHKFDV